MRFFESVLHLVANRSTGTIPAGAWLASATHGSLLAALASLSGMASLGCGNEILPVNDADTSDSAHSDSGNSETDTDTDGDTDTDTDIDMQAAYCHLQWPCSMTLASGAESEAVYGWLYVGGVTEGEGQGAGIQAQVGYGPQGVDPSTGADWVWTGADFNTDTEGLEAGVLSNDEYSAIFTAPTNSSGSDASYDYAYRFSGDNGGTWLYCDLGGDGCGGLGSDDGYDSSTAGKLTVLSQ